MLFACRIRFTAKEKRMEILNLLIGLIMLVAAVAFIARLSGRGADADSGCG